MMFRLTTNQPIALCGLTLQELREIMEQQGHRAFRANQVLDWIYRHRVVDFSGMTNLPVTLRTELAERFSIMTSRPVKCVASEDGTKKLAIRLADGNVIECVLLRYRHWTTVCLSSQVGCPIGCAFCASGANGFQRNLSTAEVVEQLLHLLRATTDIDRIHNIVVMGTGEPLLNLDNVLAALDIAHAEWAFGIGWRRVTISTVGVPNKIRQLESRGIPVRLAVSLHAPNDEIRSELIPANRKWPIAKILNAADHYASTIRREYTVEYLLLEDVNSRPVHAEMLADLLHGRHCLVNLIRFNKFPGTRFSPASAKTVKQFQTILQRRGIRATVRRSLGEELQAACGQLRASFHGKNGTREDE